MKCPCKKIIQVSAVILFVLLSVEFLLRFIDPSSLSYYRNVKMLHVYHPDYFVALKPDADFYIRHHSGLWEGRFTTNSRGFRATSEEDHSRPHLACLGDSLVMGFGVSDHETFCSLLDGVEIDNKKFQTFNLGVDAFGSLGYLKRLREVSGSMQLDTVLLFVSANDFTMVPDLRALGYLSDDETDEFRMNNSSEKLKFRLQFEATRLSYTLMALKLAAEHLQIKRVQFAASMIEELEKSGILPSDRADAGIFKYIKFTFYRFPAKKDCSGHNVTPSSPPESCPWEIPVNQKCYKLSDPEMSLPELPEITSDAYDAMIALSREKGFRLVPVMFPVNASAMYCLMNNLESQEYVFAHQMKLFFEKRGVPVMDLSPYVKNICNIRSGFPGAEERSPGMWDIIIRGDGHLTRAGNRWIADSIVKELHRVR